MCAAPTPPMYPMLPIRLLPLTSRLLLAAALALVALAAQAAPPRYRLDYRIGFDPAAGEAIATIKMIPGTGRLQRLRFSVDPKRHRSVEGDGRISREKDVLTWRPPKQGGTLTLRYKVSQRRADGGYVARMTDSWAIFRADRLMPPMAALAPDRAVSDARLWFDLPPGWVIADIGYRLDREQGWFPIVNEGRRFQQPLGWLIAGDIGNRREFIDEMEVSVAAPKGGDMRRHDMLAVVNATAMDVRAAFGRLPPKLLIVGADDPFWRGGLSGPNSLFMHAERPLISENGSSTLLHEMVHVTTRITGAPNDDWIAEGLAEFYSVELLRRSGLISANRAERAFGWMKRHGKTVRRLQAKHSSGPRTARALTLFRALDEEIRSASGGDRSLDQLVQALIGKGRVSTAMLRREAENVLGRPSRVLDTPLLD